jgi:signal transduction histidine kinase
MIAIAATEFSTGQDANTKAALLKSESSNLDLERFVAIAAHDLKSPLAAISGYLTLLNEEFTKKLGKEGVLFVRLMIGVSQRMRNLGDSLLDYSRLTNAKKLFQPTNISNNEPPRRTKKF